MTVIEWFLSPWPYLLFGGTAAGVTYLNRRDRQRDAARRRHPAREVPSGLAAYDPHNGEWFNG